jgi:hypothetical protein
MESKTVGWKINKSKPVSLDYVNPRFGYRGNSVTGSAYWIKLDDVRSKEELERKLKHLSGKVWFNSSDFLAVRTLALSAEEQRRKP